MSLVTSREMVSTLSMSLDETSTVSCVMNAVVVSSMACPSLSRG